MIFDTHAHYDDEAFDDDRDRVFEQFAAYGIGRVVNPGSTRESIDRIVSLTAQYPFLYGALGIHPSECSDMTEEWIEDIRTLLHVPRKESGKGSFGRASQRGHDAAGTGGAQESVSVTDPDSNAAEPTQRQHSGMVAVGEIGLDYHWDEPAHDLQQYWLRRQIQLAREENLPIIIHSRDAAADTMRILKEEGAAQIGAVIHCYSYSAQMALEFVKMGFYIGIGGVVTFKNGRRMKETVAAVPMDRILIETDSPYLAPVPYRGKRNCSLYLPYIVQEIARIRGMSEEDVILQTQLNAERFYRLPHVEESI